MNNLESTKPYSDGPWLSQLHLCDCEKKSISFLLGGRAKKQKRLPHIHRSTVHTSLLLRSQQSNVSITLFVQLMRSPPREAPLLAGAGPEGTSGSSTQPFWLFPEAGESCTLWLSSGHGTMLQDTCNPAYVLGYFIES